MIDKDRAKAILEQYLNEPPRNAGPFAVRDEHTVEKEYGWIFVCNTREYIDTGNWLDALVPSIWAAVTKEGAVHLIAGGGKDPEKAIRNFEIENNLGRPAPLGPPFLTGEWRHLLMLNYEIDPAILKPLVPYGTELDFWDDKAICSMVGFRFLNTRVLKIGFPFHRNFDEVNLRFYVRRLHEGQWRRAVVFVREVVPRTAIAAIARLAYNEPYLAMPMRHVVKMEEAENGGEGLVRYEWRGKRWFTLEATTSGPPQPLEPNSEAEFITEHYWGYTSQRDGGSLQYQVEHPRWRVWQAQTSRFDCDIDSMYGPQFRAALQAPPRSAFVAEGSSVAVYHGVRI